MNTTHTQKSAFLKLWLNCLYCFHTFASRTNFQFSYCPLLCNSVLAVCIYYYSTSERLHVTSLLGIDVLNEYYFIFIVFIQYHSTEFWMKKKQFCKKVSLIQCSWGFRFLTFNITIQIFRAAFLWNTSESFWKRTFFQVMLCKQTAAEARHATVPFCTYW